MLDNGPHLAPWDVLSLGVFCPWDVLSLGTLCPWDVLSLDVLYMHRLNVVCSDNYPHAGWHNYCGVSAVTSSINMTR